jgi:hypothetical protein
MAGNICDVELKVYCTCMMALRHNSAAMCETSSITLIVDRHRRTHCMSSRLVRSQSSGVCLWGYVIAPCVCSSRGWMDPVSDLLLLRKSDSTGNRTRNLWICSQDLWPVDHRGGQCSVIYYCFIYQWWWKPSPRMLRRVAIVRTNVSEEHITSIIRVKIVFAACFSC